MNLETLLQSVATGALDLNTAKATLEKWRSAESEALCLDVQREKRCGMPEVVYARGKTHEQVKQAMLMLQDRHGYALATGVDEACMAMLQKQFPSGQSVPVGKLFSVGQMPQHESQDSVMVVGAGTSDLPVAMEALHTLRFAGIQTDMIIDVGVAGLYRLLRRVEEIEKCSVVIAVAGMEGTLPGVLTGLIGKPVIAVPTSVGYGSHFQGLAPLLAMLNSCASGMAVVNIDNGFGAAMMAIRIIKSRSE